MPAELPSGASVRLRRRISWMDTDAAGIYHWTTAFRLAEDAEAALHTALGIVDETFGATPRLRVAAEFRRTLRFNDLVEVHLVVQAVGRTSVSYAIRIDGPEGVAVDGELTACLIDRASGRAVPWPDHMRERLRAGGPQEVVE